MKYNVAPYFQKNALLNCIGRHKNNGSFNIENIKLSDSLFFLNLEFVKQIDAELINARIL
jgi:hypothetical protein